MQQQQAMQTLLLQQQQQIQQQQPALGSYLQQFGLSGGYIHAPMYSSASAIPSQLLAPEFAQYPPFSSNGRAMHELQVLNIQQGPPPEMPRVHGERAGIHSKETHRTASPNSTSTFTGSLSTAASTGVSGKLQRGSQLGAVLNLIQKAAQQQQEEQPKSSNVNNGSGGGGGGGGDDDQRGVPQEEERSAHTCTSTASPLASAVVPDVPPTLVGV
jgi:hypothetical protein